MLCVVYAKTCLVEIHTPLFTMQMAQVPVALLVCPSQEFLSGTFYHHTIRSIQIIISIVALYIYLTWYM